jgi:Uma2 family endonuclease
VEENDVGRAEETAVHRRRIPRHGRAGILAEDDRVELIEAEIVEMAAIGTAHAACVDRLNHFLMTAAAGRVHVRVQNPVRLSDFTEPQPDLALLHVREDFHAGGHPGPGDTLLVVEVAHTTLGYDRIIKLPLYARSAVSEVWIVNIDEDVVEVYRDPRGGRYTVSERVERGGVLRPAAISGFELPAERVLG